MEELLAKYFEGHCSSEESLTVNQWKEENPVQFKQYKEIWEMGEQFKYPTNENSFYLIQHKIDSKPSKVSFIKDSRFWRVAAAILLVCVIGVSYYVNLNKPKTITDTYSAFVTANKPLQKVTLDDGTKVWLKQGAQLNISNTFNTETREVKLVGDAFFEVAKNSEIPFIIHNKPLDIKVVGTSFSITQDKHEVVVAVKSGQVDVKDKMINKTLDANQSVTYNLISKKATVKEITDINTWAWTDRLITFDNTDLKEVIAKLESIYNVDIEYNAAYAQVPFTGKFDNASIEEIISVLQTSLDVKLELNHN